ncbi:hypothetical protein VNO77_02033 [Canavalia gladiata]|uniref:Uncharacterized protein n=1 Tax=Canavalia gladiata TaxID=3824 RepID=A0AAN9MT00_CANGL
MLCCVNNISLLQLPRGAPTLGCIAKSSRSRGLRPSGMRKNVSMKVRSDLRARVDTSRSCITNDPYAHLSQSHVTTLQGFAITKKCRIILAWSSTLVTGFAYWSEWLKNGLACSLEKRNTMSLGFGYIGRPPIRDHQVPSVFTTSLIILDPGQIKTDSIFVIIRSRIH